MWELEVPIHTRALDAFLNRIYAMRSGYSLVHCCVCAGRLVRLACQEILSAGQQLGEGGSTTLLSWCIIVTCGACDVNTLRARQVNQVELANAHTLPHVLIGWRCGNMTRTRHQAAQVYGNQVYTQQGANIPKQGSQNRACPCHNENPCIRAVGFFGKESMRP